MSNFGTDPFEKPLSLLREKVFIAMATERLCSYRASKSDFVFGKTKGNFNNRPAHLIVMDHIQNNFDSI